MITLTKTIDIPVRLTVEDVALLFCGMDANEQAKFFNECALNFDRREFSWPMQLQYIQESKELKVKGKSLMSLIGDYGA